MSVRDRKLNLHEFKKQNVIPQALTAAFLFAFAGLGEQMNNIKWWEYKVYVVSTTNILLMQK